MSLHGRMWHYEINVALNEYMWHYEIREINIEIGLNNNSPTVDLLI